ncbi:MAG: glycerophosphodiester phosphodiesterase [Micromonosporaceae bacterium]
MAYRVAAVAAVGLLVAAAAVAVATTPRGKADAATPAAALPDRPVLTIAHRGASGYAPENTLPAIELGVAQHADLVEVDVQRTKDGVLVVLHDTTLKRTTDVERLYPERGPWRLADFTYAELAGLDAGSWFGEEFAGARVPRLSEVLDTLADTDTGLLLEAKAPHLYPGIAQALADELDRRSDWTDSGRRLVVQSFDWRFIREYAELRPKTVLGVLGTPRPAELATIATYADQVNPQHGSFDAAYQRKLHELGLESFVWTIDDPEQLRATIGLGADGVITNRPDVLHRLLHPTR